MSDSTANSCVFYRSYLNAIRLLPEDEQLDFIYAFFSYALDNKEPDLKTDMQRAMFDLMRPTSDATAKRYRANVENGKKGGRPRKKADGKNPTKTHENPSKKPNENPWVKPTEKTHENLNYNYDDNCDNTDTSEGFKTLSDEPVDVAKEKLLQTIENVKAEQQKKEAEASREAEEREAARKKTIENAINSMREAAGGDTV